MSELVGRRMMRTGISETFPPRRNRQGDTIPVVVGRTSVLQVCCDPAGGEYKAKSIVVVHAIGSLGCHFALDESRLIVHECARVLKTGGYAFLDAGHAGTSAACLASLATEAGFLWDGQCRSWWLDRYVQLALRKPTLCK